jgi:hypothetical protein
MSCYHNRNHKKCEDKCPPVHHDKLECEECEDGSRVCVCARGDISSEEKCNEKKECLPCKLPCNKKEALHILKAKRKYKIGCQSFLDMDVDIIDPFKLVDKCWYVPCFKQEGECGCDCNVPEVCESESESECESEYEVECVCKVTPAKPRCCPKKEKKKCDCSCENEKNNGCGYHRRTKYITRRYPS